MRGLLRLTGGRGLFPFAFGVAVSLFAFGRGLRRCFLFAVSVAFGRGGFRARGRDVLGRGGIAERRVAERSRATGDQQHRGEGRGHLQQPAAHGDARAGAVERLAEQDREDAEQSDTDPAEEQRMREVREVEDALTRRQRRIVGVPHRVGDEPGRHCGAAHDDHPNADLANVHVPPRTQTCTRRARASGNGTSASLMRKLGRRATRQ